MQFFVAFTHVELWSRSLRFERTSKANDNHNQNEWMWKRMYIKYENWQIKTDFPKTPFRIRPTQQAPCRICAAIEFVQLILHVLLLMIRSDCQLHSNDKKNLYKIEKKKKKKRRNSKIATAAQQHITKTYYTIDFNQGKYNLLLLNGGCECFCVCVDDSARCVLCVDIWTHALSWVGLG